MLFDYKSLSVLKLSNKYWWFVCFQVFYILFSKYRNVFVIYTFFLNFTTPNFSSVEVRRVLKKVLDILFWCSLFFRLHRFSLLIKSLINFEVSQRLTATLHAHSWFSVAHVVCFGFQLSNWQNPHRYFLEHRAKD